MTATVTDMTRPYIHAFDRSTQDYINYCLRKPEGLMRTDVVLINGTNSGREYTLHVTEDGFCSGFNGGNWILDMLSPTQYSELMGIARRMRENAHQYPDCRQLLSGGPL